MGTAEQRQAQNTGLKRTDLPTQRRRHIEASQHQDKHRCAADQVDVKAKWRTHPELAVGQHQPGDDADQGAEQNRQH